MDGQEAVGYNPSAMPTLYLVATPIGNLEDISRRAVRMLGEVSLIAAEDTRRTRRLLNACGIKTALTSYHEHNKRSKLPYLLGRLDEDSIALVSDAGMPGVSDPGYELVKAAIERGASIVAVPGPSVLPTAIAVSGLPASQFVYVGFMPRKKGERRQLLQEMAREQRTLVALEAPHRLLACLKELREIMGDRKIAVCRELTKVHEEVFRGSVSQAIAHFTQPRGEFTIVIEGRGAQGAIGAVTDSARQELRRLRAQGIPAKEAVARVASTTGLGKRPLYKAWLDAAVPMRFG